MVIILFLSFIGFFLVLNQKLRIRMEFCPAVTTSSITSLLVIGGILGALRITALTLVFLGIVSLVFIVSNYKALHFSKRDYLVLGSFILVFLYFALILNNQHLYHYDNFSHWATVVKSMLLTNRLPNESDVLVTFKSYPLGSSVFIYYICSLIGMNEGYMMMAQLLVMLSLIYTSVALINRKNLWLLSLIILWVISALTVYCNIYMLLVDTVIALSGTAILSISIANRDNFNQREIEKISLIIMPIAFSLIQTKNSGLYFLIIALIYFSKTFWSKLDIKGRILFIVTDIAVPLSSILMWKAHLSRVFNDVNNTEHALSVEHFATISSEKSKADITAIITAMLEKFPYSTTTYMLFLAGLIFVVVIGFKIARKESCRKILMELTGMILAYLLYVISVLVMYIFSMPLDEALELASYDRYMLSSYIFLMGMTIMFVLRNYEHGIKTIEGTVIVLITVIIVSTYYEKLPAIVGVNNAIYSSREELLESISDVDIESNSMCLVYYNYTDERYLYAIARYDLWSDTVTLCNIDNLYQAEDILEYYDYFIIVTPDETVNSFADNNLENFERIGTNVYRLE